MLSNRLMSHVGASSSNPAKRNIRDSLRTHAISFEYMRGEAVADDEDVVINSGKVYTISPSSVTCGTPSNWLTIGRTNLSSTYAHSSSPNFPSMFLSLGSSISSQNVANCSAITAPPLLRIWIPIIGIPSTLQTWMAFHHLFYHVYRHHPSSRLEEDPELRKKMVVLKIANSEVSNTTPKPNSAT